jgi:hypothetical protein
MVVGIGVKLRQFVTNWTRWSTVYRYMEVKRGLKLLGALYVVADGQTKQFQLGSFGGGVLGGGGSNNEVFNGTFIVHKWLAK